MKVRPIFFMHAIRYLCRYRRRAFRLDHIENIIMKEFDAGYVPEIPDYAIDMHTIKQEAETCSISWMKQVRFSRFGMVTMIRTA